jgi:hypothetical protein
MADPTPPLGAASEAVRDHGWIDAVPPPVTDPVPPDALIEWTSLHGPRDSGPDLVVQGDGRARVSGRFGGGRPVETRLPEARVRALLHSIIDEHGFFDIAPERLDDELASGPAERREGDVLHVAPGPPYPDAGTTLIRVAAGPRRQELRVHGLPAAARLHPDAGGLQALRAIELELLALAEELGAG